MPSAMRHAALVLPPAFVESDLSVDKELLQRWPLNNTPCGAYFLPYIYTWPSFCRGYMSSKAIWSCHGNKVYIVLSFLATILLGFISVPLLHASPMLSHHGLLIFIFLLFTQPHPCSGTPSATAHRPTSYPRRQASFDSPREVPLPSSNMPSTSTLTTPSAAASHARKPESSTRMHDFTGDYFSSAPYSRRSSLSTRSSLSPPLPPTSTPGSSPLYHKSGSYKSTRFMDGDDGSSSSSVNGSGSDWTHQTSPSPPPDERCSSSPEAQELAGLMADQPDSAFYSDLASAQHSEPTTSTLGRSMTTSLSPQLRTSMTNHSTLGVRSSPNPTSVVPLLPRPHSLPNVPSNPYASNSHIMNNPTTPIAQDIISTGANATSNSGWPDRGSSSSLPLPKHIPFHVLPRVGYPSPHTTLELAVTYDPSAGAAHAERVRSTHEKEVGKRTKTKYSSQSVWGTHTGEANTSRQAGEGSASPPRAPARSSVPASASIAPTLGSHTSNYHSHNHSQVQPQNDSADVPVLYPAPEPPVILSPTATPGPFLSHAPPPPDCWIEVETMRTEYKLTVRLPGFARDGITLASKRRRVLHVVADSWENGGGEYLRTVSGVATQVPLT